MNAMTARLESLRPVLLSESGASAAFENQLALAQTEWRSREEHERSQLTHLRAMVRFAVAEVPFWRDRLDADKIATAPSLSDALAHIPVLEREELRLRGTALAAARLPEGHKQVQVTRSSGSTGTIVSVPQTNVFLRWQQILNVRSYLWGGFDFAAPIAFIHRRPPGEAAYPLGLQKSRWASAAVLPFPTGPAFMLNATTPLEQQLEWLERVRPAYLFTMPSILRGLAGVAPPALAGALRISAALTVGEVVDQELRRSVEARFGMRIHDAYACQEAGCLAIQCPSAPAYHVPAETVIVEVVDQLGRPCRAGETGRVLVTPLFNFAAPLFRYALGDYAEAGEACSCGRQLPVLRRIRGRRRNSFVTVDGRLLWPDLDIFATQTVAPIREYQFRQTAFDQLEVSLAVDSPLRPGQENALRTLIAAAFFEVPLQIRIRYVAGFPPTANGKHEEFISSVDMAGV